MQPVQIRMARAALELSVEALAKKAGVESSAVTLLEEGDSAAPDAVQALSLFLSSQGIEFIDGDAVRAKTPASGKFVTVEQLTTENDGGEG